MAEIKPGERQEASMEETKGMAPIYTSYDYNSFKVLTYNRKKNEHLVDALKGSIEIHGFLMPILVTQINGDGEYFIVDGQHRFWAAEALSEPIKFTVIPVEESKLPVLVSSINTIGKKWGYQDFQNMYVILNKPGHLELQRFIDTNAVTLMETMTLFGFTGTIRNSGAAAGKIAAFKNGTLTVMEEEVEKAQDRWSKAWEVINYSEAWQDFKNDKSFRDGVISLVRMPGYDQGRMIGQLVDKAGRVVRSRTRGDYQRLLVDAYNLNLRAASRLSTPGRE